MPVALVSGGFPFSIAHAHNRNSFAAVVVTDAAGIAVLLVDGDAVALTSIGVVPCPLTWMIAPKAAMPGAVAANVYDVGSEPVATFVNDAIGIVVEDPATTGPVVHPVGGVNPTAALCDTVQNATSRFPATTEAGFVTVMFDENDSTDAAETKARLMGSPR